MIKNSKDKMMRSAPKQKATAARKEIKCTEGHETQCRSGNPDHKDECECRCHGQNHGADRQKSKKR